MGIENNIFMNPDIEFIINSIEEERKVVERFKDSIEFFKKQGIRFSMPERRIEEEYDESVYQIFLKKAEAAWAEHDGKFVERLQLFFKVPSPLKFTVHITQYGPYGFYDDHGNPSVTVNRHVEEQTLRVIRHEMIHTMVEPYVRAQTLNHKQKEFIVETLGTMFDSVGWIQDPE